MDDPRRRLIAVLRHRLHNPLQAVLAEAELLSSTASPRAGEVHDSARAIANGARRMAAALDELERAAEPEEPADANAEDTALARVLAGELALLSRSLERGGATDLRTRLRRTIRLLTLWVDAGAPGARAAAGEPDHIALVALTDRIRRLEAENRRLRSLQLDSTHEGREAPA